MKMRLPFVFFILAGVVLHNGCSANRPRAMSPVPVASPMLTIIDTEAFRTAYKASFGLAIYRYPAKAGFHEIPLGDYLLAELLQAIRAHAEITHLKLEKFDAFGRDRFGIPNRHEGTITAEISFAYHGRSELFTYSAENLPLGVTHVGDATVLGVADRETPDRFFHPSVRKAGDAIVQAFSAHITKLGSVPDE